MRKVGDRVWFYDVIPGETFLVQLAEIQYEPDDDYLGDVSLHYSSPDPFEYKYSYARKHVTELYDTFAEALAAALQRIKQ